MVMYAYVYKHAYTYRRAAGPLSPGFAPALDPLPANAPVAVCVHAVTEVSHLAPGPLPANAPVAYTCMCLQV